MFTMEQFWSLVRTLLQTAGAALVTRGYRHRDHHGPPVPQGPEYPDDAVWRPHHSGPFDRRHAADTGARGGAGEDDRGGRARRDCAGTDARSKPRACGGRRNSQARRDHGAGDAEATASDDPGTQAARNLKGRRSFLSRAASTSIRSRQLRLAGPFLPQSVLAVGLCVQVLFIPRGKIV